LAVRGSVMRLPLLSVFRAAVLPGLWDHSNAVEEVARRARAALGTQSVPAPPEENLGYRGFEIRGGRTVGLPDDLIVFGGVISDRTEKTGAHWIDSADLEVFLLEDAQRRGFADLLESGGAPRRLR
jgi:hypothetical protein